MGDGTGDRQGNHIPLLTEKWPRASPMGGLLLVRFIILLKTTPAGFLPLPLPPSCPSDIARQDATTSGLFPSPGPFTSSKSYSNSFLTGFFLLQA